MHLTNCQKQFIAVFNCLVKFVGLCIQFIRWKLFYSFLCNLISINLNIISVLLDWPNLSLVLAGFVYLFPVLTKQQQKSIVFMITELILRLLFNFRINAVIYTCSCYNQFESLTQQGKGQHKHLYMVELWKRKGFNNYWTKMQIQHLDSLPLELELTLFRF